MAPIMPTDILLGDHQVPHHTRLLVQMDTTTEDLPHKCTYGALDTLLRHLINDRRHGNVIKYSVI